MLSFLALFLVGGGILLGDGRSIAMMMTIISVLDLDLSALFVLALGAARFGRLERPRDGNDSRVGIVVVVVFVFFWPSIASIGLWVVVVHSGRIVSGIEPSAVFFRKDRLAAKGIVVVVVVVVSRTPRQRLAAATGIEFDGIKYHG